MKGHPMFVPLSTLKLQPNGTVNCLAGVNMQTRVYSQRLLYLVTNIIAMTVYTAYAAFLISFLTVHRFSLPFNSLRGLVDTGSYRLGVLANSAHIDDFKVSDMILDRCWEPLLGNVRKNN
jgi:hypothetical protein